jgi:DNA-binding transcriptional MocR family regulator
LQGNRAVALRSIGQHFPAGTRASPPEGGYFLWIELPTRIDALALHRLALAHHVSSAPGHLFSADHRFRHHLRINFGQADSAQLDAALKQLGKLANSLAQRGSAP